MTDAPSTPSGREARRSRAQLLARDYCCTRCGVPADPKPVGALLALMADAAAAAGAPTGREE